jgi:hypothetical protein
MAAMGSLLAAGTSRMIPPTQGAMPIPAGVGMVALAMILYLQDQEQVTVAPVVMVCPRQGQKRMASRR